MKLITIAVQCHNYQRRLCWMLSSLCEQTTSDKFVVDIAHMPGNGTPCTEDIIMFYGNFIQIKDSAWTDYTEFQKRGLVRNRQLRECATEWLLFADCDMVYHPEYIDRLAQELQQHHPKATYMLSAGRTSAAKDLAYALVDSTIALAPVHIYGAFGRVQELPRTLKGNLGAGFSQLINLRHANHEGYYVSPKRNPDSPWIGGYHRPHSDIRFRRRIAERGGRRRSLPDWFADNLIHLNHDRDSEVGFHLETQR